MFLTIVNGFRIQVVIHQAVLYHFFILSTWFTIIKVRVNRQASTWGEVSPNLKLAWFQERNQILTNGIDAIFMKIPMIAVAK